MRNNAGETTIKTAVSLLMLVALTVLAAYLYSRQDEQLHALSAASAGWPSVSGLITSSSLETRRQRVGSAHGSKVRLEVAYEYVVDDRVFENDRVRFDQDRLSSAEKELLVRTHPVGKKVQVYYNPDRPTESVLVRGSYP